MSSIIHFDQHLFKLINSQWSNGFFDWLMPLLRNKLNWIPLYVVVLALLVWKYKLNAAIIILFAIVTVFLTDQISAGLIKPAVDRLRPCSDPLFKDQVRLLISCGPGFSFPSAHASNHFGVALFFIALLPKYRKWILPLALIWAGSISYAQVYVGLHYPFDVLTGAILGICIGLLTGYICRKYITKRNPDFSK